MIEIMQHFFVGGVYLKQMRLAEDAEVVQHSHNYDHASLLATGCVIVRVDGQHSTHWAPSVIEIKAGKSHSFQAVNGPAIVYCIHATDCTDPADVDQVLIKAAS